jgi:sugar phosphate isomerase/epimerase
MEPSSEGGQRQSSLVRKFLEICRELGGATARVSTGGQGLSVQKIVDWVGSHPLPGQRDALWQQKYATRLLGSAVAVKMMSRVKSGPPSNLSRTTMQKVERCVSTLRALRPVLDDLDMQLAIENHWGISTDPMMLVDIVRRSESDRIGTCPDFANFHPTQDRYEGLELLALLAKHVHVKTHAFDPSGKQISIDVPRCLRILQEAGYDGALSIEYEGDGDVEAAIQKARDLIVEHWHKS